MKNIQVFDGADNAVYDIFAATDEEFASSSRMTQMWHLSMRSTRSGRRKFWTRRYRKSGSAACRGARRWAFTASSSTSANTRKPTILPVGMRTRSIQTAQDYDSEHPQRVGCSNMLSGSNGRVRPRAAVQKRHLVTQKTSVNNRNNDFTIGSNP